MIILKRSPKICETRIIEWALQAMVSYLDFASVFDFGKNQNASCETPFMLVEGEELHVLAG